MPRPSPQARSRQRSRPARASVAESAAFYEALQELLRLYQFRDRNRACYGQVTPNECYALEAIERAGALTVGELAAALGLHKSNASRLATALEARGLARRRRAKGDGREVLLRVTPEGQAAHAAIRAGVQAAHRRILDRFAPETRAEIVRLLGLLAGEARQRIGGPPADRSRPQGRAPRC